MAESYNNHVSVLEMTVSAGADAQNPDQANTVVMGSGLVRVHAFCLQSPTNPVYIRLMDGQKQITPRSGFMPIPGTNVLTVGCEHALEGPPWVLRVEAYGDAVPVAVIAELADYRESDSEVKILAALKAIYTELAASRKR